ncbi:hypothetical protein M5K25_021035 [Dendrobium thyrsiflorum]|uniref:Uncharacterized protein n=1 Tax=Dendrobium thyrsiflorum TaxID=117978 RepID=A0ABD0UC44_DENTH
MSKLGNKVNYIMAERIPERDEGQSSQAIRISEDPDNVTPVGGSAPSVDPTPVGMDSMNAMSGNMMQLQMMNMMMQMMEKMQSMVGSAAPSVPPVVTPVTPTTPGSSINVEIGDPEVHVEQFCGRTGRSSAKRVLRDCSTFAEIQFLVSGSAGNEEFGTVKSSAQCRIRHSAEFGTSVASA